MDVDAVTELLGQTALFSSLDAAGRREIASRMRPFRVEAGTVLCAQGAPADTLYVIERGLLAISLRTPGDDRVMVGTCGPFGVLGEMAASRRSEQGFRAATVSSVTGLGALAAVMRTVPMDKSAAGTC